MVAVLPSGSPSSGNRADSAAAPRGRGAVRRHPWLAPVLVGLGVYCVCLVGARALLNDGDTLSHIAIGRWILAHRALPFADPFSYTAQGRLWVPHEWLSELVFAVLYDRLGWGGVIAATGLACAAAFALLTRNLAEALGPRRAAIGALAAFSLTEAHLLARPHVLAWPLLVIWMAGLVRACDRGRAPSWALLPVIVLWCNLHGGFVVGLLFAGLIAAEAAIEAPAALRPSTLRRWGVFLVLAGLAGLVSPNGINGYLLPWHMLHMNFAMSSISEWHSVDFTRPSPLEAWIALLILAGLGCGLRLPWPRVLMILLLLYMALTHVRNEELLGFIAPLLAAAPLSRQLSPAVPAAGAPPPRRDGAPAALALAALAGLLFAAGALALDRHGLAPRPEVAPKAALAAARQAGLSGHVFNSVRFGGFLMLRGVPTFVDGRADLFGDPFLERYVMATNAVGDNLPHLLDQYAVGWTLLEPSSPAVRQLDSMPSWRRVYSGSDAVIHRRTAAAR